MHQRGYILVVSCIVCVFWVNLAGGQEATPRFDRVYEAINDRPELHGSWVLQSDEIDLDVKQVALTLMVDPAGGKEQEDMVRQLLDDKIGKQSYRIERIVRLPLSHLVSRLNVELEADPYFDGSIVEGATYKQSLLGGAPGTGRQGILITLYGRVAAETKERNSFDQSMNITRICAEYMSKVPEWQEAVEAASLEKVLVVESGGAGFVKHTSSILSASRFYADGLQYFKSRQFKMASNLFQKAVLDSPQADAYRYWRILSELCQGNRELAYDLMLAFTRRGEISSLRYRQVLWSLEKVQGRPRMDLIELETRARREFHLRAIYFRDMYRDVWKPVEG